jgi:hypothetical protein
MPEQLTPELRTLRAQIAAHESWAHTENRAARTANARKAALQCFEDQVDPDGKLTPAERTRRAESLRKAHMQRMAFLSVKARQRRGGPTG